MPFEGKGSIYTVPANKKDKKDLQSSKQQVPTFGPPKGPWSPVVKHCCGTLMIVVKPKKWKSVEALTKEGWTKNKWRENTGAENILQKKNWRENF